MPVCNKLIWSFYAHTQHIYVKMTENYSFAREFAASLPKKPVAETASPKDPTTMGIAISVATYPPLGQVTQVADDEVIIYAVAEVEAGKEAPELKLWHSNEEARNSPGWTTTPFVLVSEHSAIQATLFNLQKTGKAQKYLYATIVNINASRLNFTIKFREAGGTGSWRWVADEQQIGDGTVVVNRQTKVVSIPPVPPVLDSSIDTADAPSLANFIGGLNPAFRVTDRKSVV